ncbi:branched-chain amino acid ABC transporter permease [Nocardioides hungaricus]
MNASTGFHAVATPYVDAEESRFSRGQLLGAAIGVAAVLVVIVLPYTDPSPALYGAALITMVYIPAALGQNLILGNAGLLAMGQAAFMGVGAYTAAILGTRWELDGAITMLAAVVVAGVAGVLVGIPALRIRGDYLFIVSLGFNLMVIDLAVQWVDVTGGASGLAGIPDLTLFGWEVGYGTSFYMVNLAVVAIACLVTWVLVTSRFGKTVEALRDDTPAALSVGIRPDIARVAIFGIGSALAGLSGWLLDYNLSFVGPPSFNVQVSVLIFEMAVIGGLGRVSGSIIGAVIIILIPEMLRPIQDYRDIIGGLFIVVLMIVRPQGLLGKTKIVNLIKK